MKKFINWLDRLEKFMWVEFPEKGLEVCRFTGVVRPIRKVKEVNP